MTNASTVNKPNSTAIEQSSKTPSSGSSSISERTGLQMLEALRDGRTTSSGIAQIMPMQVTQVSQGQVTITATADARHLNPAGMVHGGFAATCLDTAAALALFSSLDANVPYSTVDLNIKYVRPLAQETQYIVTGRLTERTRNLGICSSAIHDAAGKLYALASATLMIKAS
jgi:uncharacterized protein (TIGR00369 family)